MPELAGLSLFGVCCEEADMLMYFVSVGYCGLDTGAVLSARSCTLPVGIIGCCVEPVAGNDRLIFVVAYLYLLLFVVYRLWF